ncbi:MAG TPA: hypothetical protein PKA90_05980 [Ignavibacteria bacterium]|nr:hypothetical protein [Ignavibacteria bacterium]HMR39962.1 hypothetical protein [Ignavibacteria bacterium]
MKNLISVLLLLLMVTCFYSCDKSEDQEVKQSKDPAELQKKSNEDPSFTKLEGKDDHESEQAKDQESENDNENDNEKNDNSGKNEKSENRFNTKTIKVKFPAGSTQITLDGNINGFGDNISYEFEASEGQTLKASVKPKDGDGNVRINQIYYPDGKADGPFGEKMNYKLNRSGNWKLIIGEDMMAGEPWKGTYLLTIEIK